MAEVRTTSSTGGQKGVKLARFDLIPVGPLAELAEHYGVGASKYADHQWRNGYEWSKMYAALMRHLTAWWAGYDYDVCSNDPEGCSHVDAEGQPFTAIRKDACFNHTGSHHLAAVAWHAFTGLEFAERFPQHDDRYIPTSNTLEEDEDEPLGDETFAFQDLRLLQDEINRTLQRLAEACYMPKLFIPSPDGVEIEPERLSNTNISVAWADPEPITISARFDVGTNGVTTDRDHPNVDTTKLSDDELILHIEAIDNEIANGVQRSFDRR